MANKDINTVTNSSDITNNDYIYISKSGSNLQKIKFDTFINQLYTNGTLFSNVTDDAAAAHNSIYRGKNLGTSFTSSQSTVITNGTFKDIFVGDYWNINGRKYMVAGCDCAYRCGDNINLGHHVVIVPDTTLYSAQFKNTESGAYEAGNINNITGGYIDSDMRNTNLAQATSIIEGDFGADHVLSYRDSLTNSIGTLHNLISVAGSRSWTDCKVELLSEIMLFGTMIAGMGIYESSIFKTQLPLFRYAPHKINLRAIYWLRNIGTSATFAGVQSSGTVTYVESSKICGVRPFALIA